MQTLILDSSQISAWFECPTIWTNRGLVLINKLNPEETLRPADALAMGSLMHKYLEIYYTVLSITSDPALAVRKALDFDPDEEDKVDKQFPLSPELRKKIKDRFGSYILFYPPDRDFKPAQRKRHTIGFSKDGMPKDIWEPDPIVEKGFSYKLYESSEYLFVLEGRVDFIGQSQDGTTLFMDHKTQGQAHTLYEKSIQFRNYAMATGINLGVINYIRLHEKIQTSTFVRQPLSFSSLEMKHWKQELIGIYIDIANDVQAQSFRKNRNSCGGSWGRPCQFTKLCEEYSPETRKAIQKRDYTERKEWRPW